MRGKTDRDGRHAPRSARSPGARRVALTVWDGRVSPVFDVSREVIVLELDGERIGARTRETIERPTPQQRVDRLVSLGIDLLVCGAVSTALQRDLVARGIEVVGFVAGEIDAVVEALRAGRLPAPAFAMPGCRRRRRLRGAWRSRSVVRGRVEGGE